MSKDSKSTNSGDPEIDYKNLDKLRQYIGETGKYYLAESVAPVQASKEG